VPLDLRAQDLDAALEGTSWSDRDSNDAEVSLNGAAILVTFEENAGADDHGRIETSGTPLSSCSLVVSIAAMEDLEGVGRAAIFVGAVMDVGPDKLRRGWEIRLTEVGDVVECEVGVGLEDDADEPIWDLPPEPCDATDLAMRVRVRHTGETLCFDRYSDGAWDLVHCLEEPVPAADLDVGGRAEGPTVIGFNEVQ
jgi:hypothetical protein